VATTYFTEANLGEGTNVNTGGDGCSAQRLIYDFFFHEAGRTHDRTDWFLIFHAILLEAFLTAKDGVAPAIVGSVGIVTSYLWLLSGVRQRWLMMQLGKSMGDATLMGSDLSHAYNAIFEARRKGLPTGVRWAAPVPVFCVVVPAVLLFAWLGLVAFDGLQRPLLTVIVAAAICLLASLVCCCLRQGPDISKALVDSVVPPKAGSADLRS
jgi:hypothetical protein